MKKNKVGLVVVAVREMVLSAWAVEFSDKLNAMAKEFPDVQLEVSAIAAGFQYAKATQEQFHVLQQELIREGNPDVSEETKAALAIAAKIIRIACDVHTELRGQLNVGMEIERNLWFVTCHANTVNVLAAKLRTAKWG